MGLDDVVKDRAMGVGDVKSSMEPEQVEMTEQFWGVLAVYHPSMLTWDAQHHSEKQLRYLIMLLDRALNDEIDDHIATEDNKRHIKEIREELLEYL